MLSAASKRRRQAKLDELYTVTSAIPGRIRLQLCSRQGSSGRLRRWADWLSSAGPFRNIDVAEGSGSLILHYDARRYSIQEALDSAARSAIVADSARPPQNLASNELEHRDYIKQPDIVEISIGRTQHIKAKEYRAPSRSNVVKMILPTLAVVIGAIEAVPAVLVVAVVAASIAPSAIKAFDEARARRLSIDQLDLLNVTVAVADGALLPAAMISWLINFGDVIRSRTMLKSLERHVQVRLSASRNGDIAHTISTKLLLENALLTDTQFQGYSSRLHVRASAPFVGLAGLISLSTQDIGFIVGVLKPLYDFAGAVRFGVPAILLNAMSNTTQHGGVFRTGRAVEKLAKVDAIIFFSTNRFKSRKVLHRRIKQLVKRGINHFVMPTQAEAEDVYSIATSLGKQFVIAEPIPQNPANVIGLLHRHGHTVAVVEDGGQEEEWCSQADVRIGLPAAELTHEKIDIFARHSDLRGIGHTIDLSRHSMAIAQQNLGVSAFAAGLNLGLAFVPPLAASTVSTLATAVLAYNVNRELKYDAEEAAEDQAAEPVTPDPQPTDTT